MKEPSINIEQIKMRYDIPFDTYSVLMYHPVTTEIDSLKVKIEQVVDAIIESGDNFISGKNPNNDHGYGIILEEYKRFKNCGKVRCFPLIRFKFFIEI